MDRVRKAAEKGNRLGRKIIADLSNIIRNIVKRAQSREKRLAFEITR